MPARDFFVGADDDQPAGRRVPDGRALSGLARRKSRHRLSRGECPAQRLRFRGGSGAGRAGRRRKMQTHRHRRRRGNRLSDTARKRRADNSPARPLDAKAVDAAVRDALAGIEPMSDLHASADYRRRAAVSLASARGRRCPEPRAREENPCALSSTSTAPRKRSRSSRAPLCSIACATRSASRARMPAASMASAAPAPCCSTASRCAHA